MRIPGKRVPRTRLVRTRSSVAAVEVELSSRTMTVANPATKQRPCNCCVMLQSTPSEGTSNGFNGTAESIRRWKSDDFDSQKEQIMDYLKLYDLERYLFEVVNPAFQKNHELDAFDFFCIVIWKANRAKSKVADKLCRRDSKKRKDLNAIVGDLTSSIYEATSDKERMRIIVQDWGLRLPMASAILTVLYPERFTVYDVRVCEVLAKYRCVQDRRFDGLWAGYEGYREDVESREPSVSTLRDRDRVLWARSFEKQLREDLSTLFSKDRARNG